ncbi:hypothetical protein ACFE04_000155 [Oxalis oulophora]
MSSNSPCAACKFLRRKCTQECVFAPYFPPDQPKKFEVVHKVFGASNVTKLLNELSTAQREDAVNSLAYEAEARLRDPVYGCVGHISLLQTRLKQAQSELYNAKKELAAYIGPQAMMTLLPNNSGFMGPHMAMGGGGGGPSLLAQHGQLMNPMMGIPTGVAHPGGGGGGGGGGVVIREPQQQPGNHHHHNQAQIYEQQQLAAVAREQELQMLRNYEQQQRQGQDMLRYNNGGGFDNPATIVAAAAAGAVTVTGFNQLNEQTGMQQPSLALGQFENNNNLYHQQPPQQVAEPPPHQHHAQLQAQILLHHGQGQGQVVVQQQAYEGSVITHQQGPVQKREGSDEAETYGGGGGSNL